MKKLFLLLAIVTYAGVAVYSLTRMKPLQSQAQAGNEPAPAVAAYKLFTNNQAALMKFYSEVFDTDWEAVEGGYQGQVLDANVMIAATKKRTRRASLQLQSDELDPLVTRIIDAGSNVKSHMSGAGKGFVTTDPDGNTLWLSKR